MSQTTMIAMLEEAEDVLRRAGCDMTADRVRGVLQAQQAKPVARDVIAKLVALTRAVNLALEDSEERDGADGREHVIDSVNFDAVCDALEALEDLPDNKPGWTMNAADKAEWALRHLSAAQPPAVAVPELRQVRRAQDGMPSANYAEGFDHGWNDCVYQMRAMHAAPRSAVAVPDGYALVPIEPTEEQWGGLARDIMMAFDLGGKSPASLLANMRLRWEELPEWMRKELHDPESTAVLSKGTRAVLIYRAMLAAAPQAAVAAPLPPYDVFSDDDGDSWEQHPASDNFVHGLQLGDEFELLAGWHAERVTFRVTKVPDDESDDYEVEEVTTPAAAQKGGAR